MCIYICIYIHLLKHNMHIHTYVCVYIYIYIYMHIHLFRMAYDPSSQRWSRARSMRSMTSGGIVPRRAATVRSHDEGGGQGGSDGNQLVL